MSPTCNRHLLPNLVKASTVGRSWTCLLLGLKASNNGEIHRCGTYSERIWRVSMAYSRVFGTRRDIRRRDYVYDAYLTRICAVFEAYLCASGDTRISCVSESYIRRICVVYEAYWHVSGDTRICCVFEAYMKRI